MQNLISDNFLQSHFWIGPTGRREIGQKVDFLQFSRFFAKVRLLIKIHFLYNKFVHFMVPSEYF